MNDPPFKLEIILCRIIILYFRPDFFIIFFLLYLLSKIGFFFYSVSESQNGYLNIVNCLYELNNFPSLMVKNGKNGTVKHICWWWSMLNLQNGKDTIRKFASVVILGQNWWNVDRRINKINCSDHDCERSHLQCFAWLVVESRSYYNSVKFRRLMLFKDFR